MNIVDSVKIFKDNISQIWKNVARSFRIFAQRIVKFFKRMIESYIKSNINSTDPSIRQRAKVYFRTKNRRMKKKQFKFFVDHMQNQLSKLTPDMMNINHG